MIRKQTKIIYYSGVYVNLVIWLGQRVRIPVNTQVTYGNYMILSTLDRKLMVFQCYYHICVTSNFISLFT